MGRKEKVLIIAALLLIPLIYFTLFSGLDPAISIFFLFLATGDLCVIGGIVWLYGQASASQEDKKLAKLNSRERWNILIRPNLTPSERWNRRIIIVLLLIITSIYEFFELEGHKWSLNKNAFDAWKLSENILLVLCIILIAYALIIEFRAKKRGKDKELK
ncbi:MAG: hypothetical protein NT067_03110 [Candidatus Diapherotrites archaeon]|nr:hypothetical protein [Candidatus Diapherotrites archaeon]